MDIYNPIGQILIEFWREISANIKKEETMAFTQHSKGTLQGVQQ